MWRQRLETRRSRAVTGDYAGDDRRRSACDLPVGDAQQDCGAAGGVRAPAQRAHELELRVVAQGFRNGGSNSA